MKSCSAAELDVLGDRERDVRIFSLSGHSYVTADPEWNASARGGGSGPANISAAERAAS
jgi:hypothetical protein